MKKRTVSIVSILIAMTYFGNAAIYAQNPSVLTLAERYSEALQQADRHKGRQSLQELLRKGTLLADRLNDMENLNSANYTLFEKRMKGFVVNREEIVFVKPDVDFFSRLAKQRGLRPILPFSNCSRR
jgi:hypothetical protein